MRGYEDGGAASGGMGELVCVCVGFEYWGVGRTGASRASWTGGMCNGDGR